MRIIIMTHKTKHETNRVHVKYTRNFTKYFENYWPHKDNAKNIIKNFEISVSGKKCIFVFKVKRKTLLKSKNVSNAQNTNQYR